MRRHRGGAQDGLRDVRVLLRGKHAKEATAYRYKCSSHAAPTRGGLGSNCCFRGRRNLAEGLLKFEPHHDAHNPDDEQRKLYEVQHNHDHQVIDDDADVASVQTLMGQRNGDALRDLLFAHFATTTPSSVAAAARAARELLLSKGFELRLSVAHVFARRALNRARKPWPKVSKRGLYSPC